MKKQILYVVAVDHVSDTGYGLRGVFGDYQSAKKKADKINGYILETDNCIRNKKVKK